MAIERDLVNGDFRRQARAPTLASVIEEYMTYLQSEGRAARTLAKYRYCYPLVLELAEKRSVQRVSEVDLRFIDAFRRMRVDGRAKPKSVLTDTVVIRQLLNFAVRRKLIDRDPLAGL